MENPKDIAGLAGIIGFFAFAGLCALLSDEAMNWTRFGLMGAALTYGATRVIGHVGQQVLTQEEESEDTDDAEGISDEEEFDPTAEQGSESASPVRPSQPPSPEVPDGGFPDEPMGQPAMAGATPSSEARRVNHARASSDTPLDKEPSGD